MLNILLMLAPVALVAVALMLMVVKIDHPSEPGPLDSHAPQVVSLLLGLILAILARVGLGLTEADVSLLTTLLTLLVPVALSYLGGLLTERFTFAARTVRRIKARGGDEHLPPEDPTAFPRPPLDPRR